MWFLRRVDDSPVDSERRRFEVRDEMNVWMNKLLLRSPVLVRMTHSRPKKSAAPPPPLPLSTTVFCRSCARVITPRSKSLPSSNTPQKYCSARCRSSPPTQPIHHTINQIWLSSLHTSSSPVSTELVETEVFEPIRSVEPPSRAEDAQKIGEEKAKQREMVRQAGRRLVVFGTDEDPPFEIVQGPPWRVVEGSFAKGEFWLRKRGV